MAPAMHQVRGSKSASRRVRCSFALVRGATRSLLYAKALLLLQSWCLLLQRHTSSAADSNEPIGYYLGSCRCGRHHKSIELWFSDAELDALNNKHIALYRHKSRSLCCGGSWLVAEYARGTVLQLYCGSDWDQRGNWRHGNGR